MAVYGIDYDEGNKKDLGYKSVHISYDSLKKKKVFNSGDFVKDWFDLMFFMVMELSDIVDEPFWTGSSSVDHFFMDGADELYDELYLTEIDGQNVLSDDPSLYDECLRFYVPKGERPTWSEFKTKYKSK